MLEMVRICSRLKPEALTCDGELPGPRSSSAAEPCWPRRSSSSRPSGARSVRKRPSCLGTAPCQPAVAFAAFAHGFAVAYCARKTKTIQNGAGSRMDPTPAPSGPAVAMPKVYALSELEVRPELVGLADLMIAVTNGNDAPPAGNNTIRALIPRTEFPSREENHRHARRRAGRACSRRVSWP